MNNDITTREGNIKEISYIPNTKKIGSPFLGELIGLAAGTKKNAALEISKKEDIDIFMAQLKFLSPKGQFESIITPSYDWIMKIKNYKLNLFIGKEKKEIIQLEKLYNQKPDNINVHIQIGQLLSYPKCCCEKNIWPGSLSDRFSLIRANKIDFEINNFYIRSDSNARIICHYMCNHSCPDSIEFAKKTFNFLKKFPDILSFYEKVFKLPILMLSPSKKMERSVGDGVIFAFDGYYENDKLLNYKKVYYLGKSEYTQYLNKEEGEYILKKILCGNKIKIEEDGMIIYNNSQITNKIVNDRLVFIWPN